MRVFSQKDEPEASRGTSQGTYSTARAMYLFNSVPLDFITVWACEGSVLAHSSNFPMESFIEVMLSFFCHGVSSVLEAGFFFVYQSPGYEEFYLT